MDDAVDRVSASPSPVRDGGDVRPLIVLVTPALADANNGNWQTARRWAGYLRSRFRVVITREWDGSAADAMIALHARRSASSIAAFAASGRPLALVLTGTDLYRDIHADEQARRSLRLARRLVVLHERGIDDLPGEVRDRAGVIHQSAPRMTPRTPRPHTFDLLLVGHLRAEKDPLTAVRALRRLRGGIRERLRLRIVGGERDPALGAALRIAARGDRRIEWLGALDHDRTRREIARGQVLLLPSRMEGGANVLIEAVRSGVPVLASRISGSVGLLGRRYPGYFPVGDDRALAAAIARSQDRPDWRTRLITTASRRAARFAPERERDAVIALADTLLR